MSKVDDTMDLPDITDRANDQWQHALATFSTSSQGVIS